MIYELLKDRIINGGGEGPTPIGTKNITDLSLTNVAAYATAQVVDEDIVAENIKKDVNILGVVGSYEAPAAVINPLSITANGTYTAPSGTDGYSPITVNVPSSGFPNPLSVNTLEWFDNDNRFGNLLPSNLTINCANATSLGKMFNGALGVGDLSGMTINLPSLATGTEKHINLMFNGCNNLTQLPTINIANNAGISGSITINSLFKSCYLLNPIPSNYLTNIISKLGDNNPWSTV